MITYNPKMPPHKKPVDPSSIEQKEYRVFNPENLKQTTEVPVKQVEPASLEKVEKIGDKEKIKKELKKRTKPVKRKTTRKRTKKTEKRSAQFKEKPLKKDGYTLVITEKPQAAAKIAAALSEGKERKITNRNKVSYFELNRNNKPVIVACAVGHLFSISQNIKGTDYPIFDISWFKNSDVKRGLDFSKKYYEVIEKLVKNAGEIVVATDFDVEGEVIGYTIVKYIANQKDAKRMKFSSLTPSELQKAYDNRQQTIEWGQAIAGETRHFLDWLYGINLSRALMSSIKTTGKFAVMSIGRVQGPALNLIVNKEKQIQAFKPTSYWQIFATINDNKNILELKHNKDITKKLELEKFEKLEQRKAQASTKKTKQIITPPAPFDLTSLQTEAYKFHSITPSNALSVAQKLYLAGLISYPRTSSQKIPDLKEAKKILDRLGKTYPELTKHKTRDKPIEGNKSDPAHPAIIPTGITKKLDDYDEKIYNLIVKRFISCFCDDAELANKRVEMEIDKLKFSAKGMGIINKGWMDVYPVKMEEKEIPDFDGEVNIDKIKIEEKMTKPPKRYSPASIITELEKRNLGTKCLTENCMINVNNKKTSIKEIFAKAKNLSKEKNIKTKSINLKTISLDKNNKPVISESNLISRRKLKENEKIIKIETDNSIIEMTEDHIVYTHNNNNISQIPAKNLRINDKLIGITKKYIEGDSIIDKSFFKEKYKIENKEIKHKFTPKKSRGIPISKLPIKWSTSLAWILGYYYGDGSYDGPEYNGSHSISFSTTEKKAIGLLNESFENVFGQKPYAYNLGSKYKVNCQGVISYALIKAFPKLKGKNPIEIPKEFIGDFLRGFFDADGNAHLRPKGKTKIKGIECNSFDTPRVKFTLANKNLIQWVQRLLLELDIETKINKGIAKCNGKEFDCWTILISGRDKIEKYAYKIGFDCYKEEILYKGLKCDSPKYNILKNSAIVYMVLLKRDSKIEEILKETDISRYNTLTSLKRLYKLGFISKKRYTNRNKHIYSINKKDNEYLVHCIKLVYDKISNNIYGIPIKKLSNINYKRHVYDLSVNKDFPNFIVEGNILVHNSTRANILETLYDRKYVKDKSIKATQLGINLINSLEKHSPIIINEKLTREIEKDMNNIRNSKKELKQKQEKTIEKAEKAITEISKDFKKQEVEIGKELRGAIEDSWEQEKEDNKLMPCTSCKTGQLTIKYTPRFKSYFVACTSYPDCKQTYSLPSNSLIKKQEIKDEEGNTKSKLCEECGWPMLIRIKQGKRPWIFCFNPKCPTRLPLDANGNNKKPYRYTGQKQKTKPEKKIADIKK